MFVANTTANPVGTAPQIPPKSHVDVDTSPIDAAASAPRRPTMDASIYCIMMDDSCARIAGILRVAIMRNCSPTVS